MRMSIRLWTVLVLNVFVVGVALVFGWVAQDVAGTVVEERVATEMVASVSRFLGNKTFPLSDTMMRYLREMLAVDWVAVEGDRAAIIGSSLSAAQTREFAQRIGELGSPGVVNLGGTDYHIEWHAAPESALHASGKNTRRLYLLIPSSRLAEARIRASQRVAKVVLPATGIATLVAVLLAFGTTHSVRKLTREMDRLARVAESRDTALPAPRTAAEIAAEERVGGERRRALTVRGPVETRRLARSFYGLLDGLGLARQRLAQHERLATLGKISLSVAHELRNPLSGIKMNMRVLQDRLGPAEDPGVMAILHEIDRMGLYLDELMTLAPGDARLEPARAPVRLSQITESVLTLMAGRCRHANVTLARDYPANEPMVPADANQIRQVLINLLVNALEAMPTGGSITVSIRPSAAAVRCAISDTGPGVHMDGADIFEAFVTGKPHGVGLGLYLSRQVIEHHGGRIGYENGATGAVFWFELPVAVGNSASPPPAPADPVSERL